MSDASYRWSWPAKLLLSLGPLVLWALWRLGWQSTTGLTLEEVVVTRALLGLSALLLALLTIVCFCLVVGCNPKPTSPRWARCLESDTDL